MFRFLPKKLGKWKIALCSFKIGWLFLPLFKLHSLYWRAKMSQRKFRLWAHVSSDNPSAIKPALEQVIVKKGPSDKQVKDLKLRQSLKEKARELSAVWFCPSCVERRNERGFARNGHRMIPLRGSSTMFQRELARHKRDETSRLGNRSTCINYIKT